MNAIDFSLAVADRNVLLFIFDKTWQSQTRNHAVLVKTLSLTFHVSAVCLSSLFAMYDQSQISLCDWTELSAWHIPECDRHSPPHIHIVNRVADWMSVNPYMF